MSQVGNVRRSINKILHRGLECKSENITRESRGDVTCDCLGDVTWSHGTHDFKRSVRMVRRIHRVVPG